MIKCSNPHAGYLVRKAEIDAAVNRVLDSGWYILGEEVDAFESEFASYCEISHCIGVGNGTDAIELALRALGLGVGDEVITVSHTAVATVSAIECAGCSPVFVDIDPSTFTMDPAALAGAISNKTKAIIPVHLYGHPVDMDRVLTFAEEYGLFVVEDCAQAHGARYKGKRVGSLGHVGCFSFYPTKNLGALGDGGAVVTDDPELADTMRSIREYGWDSGRNSLLAGMNTRLDALQAAILRVKLAHLDQDNSVRRSIALSYANKMDEIDGLILPEVVGDVEHVYHLYVVRVRDRDQVLDMVNNHGIGVGIHYPLPVHLQGAYHSTENSLPQTESVYSDIISLPMYPELSKEEVEATSQVLRKFFCQ